MILFILYGIILYDFGCSSENSILYEHLVELGGKVTMTLIEALERENLKPEIPEFNVGDTVKVYNKIVEGTRERIQVFEGIVISRKNSSVRETFTVRRISFGVGVEKTFPVHSPRIDKIEVVKKGKVRRAKLYYLRDLSGKAAKIKEKR